MLAIINQRMHLLFRASGVNVAVYVFRANVLASDVIFATIFVFLVRLIIVTLFVYMVRPFLLLC